MQFAVYHLHLASSTTQSIAKNLSLEGTRECTAVPLDSFIESQPFEGARSVLFKAAVSLSTTFLSARAIVASLASVVASLG